MISGDAEKLAHGRSRPERPAEQDWKVLGQARSDAESRCNRPNATHVGFVHQNVKLLFEPTCDVRTRGVDTCRDAWFPHVSHANSAKVPQRTLNTTARDHFRKNHILQPRNTRNSANPHKTPVLGCGKLFVFFSMSFEHCASFSFFFQRMGPQGIPAHDKIRFQHASQWRATTHAQRYISLKIINFAVAFLNLQGRLKRRLYSLAVPVTMLRDSECQQRFLKEDISFEHFYDSRKSPSYPPRGKVFKQKCITTLVNLSGFSSVLFSFAEVSIG